MARSALGSPRRRPDSCIGFPHHGPECSRMSGIPQGDTPHSLGEFPNVSGPSEQGEVTVLQNQGDKKMWPLGCKDSTPVVLLV